MIEDLPAPREAPNVFARACAVFFGRGYTLIGVAALVFVPWYFFRSSISQWEAAHLSHLSNLTWGPWAKVAWGFAVQFISRLLTAMVVVLVALGARQVVNDLPIDVRANLHVISARWLPLLGVTFLWTIVSEALDLYVWPVLIIPLWITAPGISADAVGVVRSLIFLGTSWSLLTVLFGGRSAIQGFLGGLLGPWQLRSRSLLIVLTFLAAHFAQRSISSSLHSAVINLTTTARGLLEALFVTFLTILLSVVYLEQ